MLCIHWALGWHVNPLVSLGTSQRYFSAKKRWRMSGMEDFDPNSPFHGFSIASHDPLRQISTKETCSLCNRSIRYFCSKCILLSKQLTDKIPLVRLPVKIKIIKHVQEANSKSTSIQAKLLAPNDIEIVDYNYDRITELVECFDNTNTVILFPSEKAVDLHNYDSTCIKTAFFIDGTWNQARSIANRFSRATFVKISKLPCEGTVFWRYQSLGKHALSTIEAIYYFLRETSGTEDAQFDNLLWFYSYFYDLIQSYYQNNGLKSFTSKHTPGYIKNKN